MTVKEGNEYIKKIDNEIKNLQKLLLLSEDEEIELAQKLEINNIFKNTVNISVNSMMAYKNILKEKIENTKVDLD